MRCLVTGAAGFIGSHLCERLLAEDHVVIGVDAFIPYYPRPIKERNLSDLLTHPAFTFVEADLRTANLSPLLDGVEVVHHEAAMAGLLRSWTEFDQYMTCNLLATQRLLEASLAAGVYHFIHVSTSSVYGREASGDETTPLRPVSPYGVTKLAAENLVQAYGANFGLPYTILRYFSIYGPRQRPDMGYHIFINALLHGRSITVFGDGEQTRGNTFVSDCVEANWLAMVHGPTGDVFNIGGGSQVSANQVIGLLEKITGRQADRVHAPARPGEQRHALADTSKARKVLGWSPRIDIETGLVEQVAWQVD